jgi:hypothetical protein
VFIEQKALSLDSIDFLGPENKDRKQTAGIEENTRRRARCFRAVCTMLCIKQIEGLVFDRQGGSVLLEL